MGINLTFQEEASLIRAWDKGDFKIDVEEVYNQLKAA
jgi:hypothetical protein